MHNIVWEEKYGKIPEGMQVHHIDGNKLNNDLSNLELVDSLTHKRKHSGCVEINGIFYKPCRNCGILYPVDDYYKRKVGISPWCKKCCIENAQKNKLRRKLESANK